ncbi:cutinase family protein [Streptomyces scabiei]|uniref:cutinase family protein n=1 Tax=Streptomyces scabiei TaxID=1930 RepID=UPI00099F0CC1|nr:cutinase family protein [Streptomyces scabiei]
MVDRLVIFSLSALLVCGVVTPQAAVEAADSARSAQGECRDIYFFGGHGLGEGGVADWGEAVQDVFDNYLLGVQGADPDIAVGSEAIKYPRSEFPEFGPKEILREWLAVERGEVVEGATALNKQLSERIKNCPDERIVLTGYSLGAWVIHEYLEDAPKVALDKILGVALLGDPQYTSTGIIPKVFPRYAITPYFPREIKSRAASWCLSYYLPVAKRAVSDPICDFSYADILPRSDLKNCELAVSGELAEEWCPHLRYIKTGGTRRAADFLISRS